MNNGKNAKALSDDRAYAEYGIEMMGWFNWNLPKMTLDALASLVLMTTRNVLLYMMESYDDLGMSWNGASRFFKGVLADPTTYVGITTFGLGTAAAKGTAAVTKEALRASCDSQSRWWIAGVEAGVYGAVDDINRQVVETAVSGEDIDLGRTQRLVQSPLY